MRPVADSHQPGADSHQQQATIPPAESGGLPSEARRWWVVDNDGRARLGRGPSWKDYAHECAAAWDKSRPAFAPHRAILATDADDARAQYAAMTTHEPPTPPADADDAGARLVAWLVERDAPVLVDLARDVIRERDEARREAAHYTDMAMQADVSCQREKARADAAEKERDEAQQAVTDAMQREGHAKGQYFETRDRADAAEATVRELRELCEEAAESITPTAYVHMAKLVARLRAAAVQPASEEVR